MNDFAGTLPISKEVMQGFDEAFGGDADVILISATYDGKPVTVIANIEHEGEFVYVVPRALWLTDEMKELLRGPSGEPLVKGSDHEDSN